VSLTLIPILIIFRKTIISTSFYNSVAPAQGTPTDLEGKKLYGQHKYTRATFGSLWLLSFYHIFLFIDGGYKVYYDLFLFWNLKHSFPICASCIPRMSAKTDTQNM
jgi:hypothetical protein